METEPIRAGEGAEMLKPRPRSVPDGCPGLDECPLVPPGVNIDELERSHEKKNNYTNGELSDAQAIHKVEEAYDYWSHLWPVLRIILPGVGAVIGLLYAAGVIQVPFAKQVEVNEIIAVQKAQGDTIKDMKDGLKDIRSDISKITAAVGEIAGDVKATRAEVRARLYPMGEPADREPQPAIAPQLPAATPHKKAKPPQSSSVKAHSNAGAASWNPFAR